MEYSIIVSEDQTYLIMTAKGEIRGDDPKVLIQPLVEVYELAAELGIRKLFIDMIEARNALGTFGNYDIVNSTIAQEPAIHHLLRVAVLVSPDDHSHDFAEVVTRNAGFNFTLYRDREQALASMKHD